MLTLRHECARENVIRDSSALAYSTRSVKCPVDSQIDPALRVLTFGM